MAVPVVAVHGLPPAPDLRAAVLSACSDALKHRVCVSADEPLGEPAQATAVIALPEGTDRRIRVTLDRFDASSGRTNRETRFAEEDPVVERWRTIGLVIAALVGETDAGEGTAAEPGSSSGVTKDLLPPAFWLGLAATAGPGLDDGSVRLGANLYGALAFRGLPFFVGASASHARRPAGEDRIEVGWTTFAIGGGAAVLVRSVDLALRLRAEFLLEYLVASGPGDIVSGGGKRVIPGIRGGGDLRWPARGTFGATLGLSVWSLSGGTAIQVDQRKLGSSRWFSYGALLGAEWSFR